MAPYTACVVTHKASIKGLFVGLSGLWLIFSTALLIGKYNIPSILEGPVCIVPCGPTLQIGYTPNPRYMYSWARIEKKIGKLRFSFE